MPHIEPAGETAFLLSFEQSPSPALTARLLAIAEALHRSAPGASLTCVPGYRTLMVHFQPGQISRSDCEQLLAQHLNATPVTDSPERETVSVPVYYDPSVAPDLAWLADRAGLSIDEVIALHSAASYHAYANGFAPGFCYLGDVPERLAAPRLDTPRRAVPAGAVGIADRQTAVYPCESPGGWRIIGRCPVTLFDQTNTPPNRINIGDRVKFEPIDRDTFFALGGVL